MAHNNLYMFAVMPPGPLATKVNEIRLDFAAKYHCKAALKPPVHITLIPPFQTIGENEHTLIEYIIKASEGLGSFETRLNGFGTFSRHEVIFIQVTDNPKLSHLQFKLAESFKLVLPGILNDYSRPYHPHITIGYRDIPHELYKAAANEYRNKEFQADFLCDKFYLWKHDGEKWQIHFEFGLV